MDESQDEGQVESASLKKTTLEAKVLEQQLSKPYIVREWLKALTGLAAIAALLAAFFQLQQSHDQRAEDRLERAIARLASPNTNERLAGVSTLRIFLEEGSSSQRKIALSSLASSVAVENEPIVRGAILDVLKRADWQSRNDVLEELANGSRGLLPAAMKKEPRQAFELWIVDHGDFGHLQNLEQAMVELLHKGARTASLAGIYCVQCNFEGLDLPGVDFRGAVLNSASFKHSTLTGSSFEHAVLLGTDFTGADLRRVKFSLDPQNAAFAISSIQNGGETGWGPDFTCANLEDADFSRQPLISLVEEADPFVNPGTYFTAKFSNANLVNADFRAMGVYGAMMPNSEVQRTPGAIKMMRNDFPFPLDIFGFDNKAKETDVPFLNGTTKKVSYLWFQGTVNPSAPIGSDPARFATSLKRIAEAFTNSNWNQAQLPNSLRQFLIQAKVPSSRTDPCASTGH